LKILKALEYKGDFLSKSGRKKDKSKAKTAFTDEDFDRFESEYFVTQQN
jgi:hypothetical protein